MGTNNSVKPLHIVHDEMCAITDTGSAPCDSNGRDGQSGPVNSSAATSTDRCAASCWAARYRVVCASVRWVIMAHISVLTGVLTSSCNTGQSSCGETCSAA